MILKFLFLKPYLKISRIIKLRVSPKLWALVPLTPLSRGLFLTCYREREAFWPLFKPSGENVKLYSMHAPPVSLRLHERQKNIFSREGTSFLNKVNMKEVTHDTQHAVNKSKHEFEPVVSRVAADD